MCVCVCGGWWGAGRGRGAAEGVRELKLENFIFYKGLVKNLSKQLVLAKLLMRERGWVGV